jgi:hypothetical protein
MLHTRRAGAMVAATLVALLVGTVGVAQASPPMAAEGTLTHATVIGFDAQMAGPNLIFEQTTLGSLSGTLSGSIEERLRVVIHPNGRFTAHGTITCECTVEGKEGVVELMVTTTGELVSPEVAALEGRYVITGATGELFGLTGVLEVEGTVDTSTALATVTYSGQIHLHP